MTTELSPQQWANRLTVILNGVYGNGPDRFPVKVGQLAKEYSLQLFPDDSVTLVRGDNLPGFDGALYRAPAHKRGWGIIYNNSMRSRGRVNFTLAHEFGHYLLHRQKYPEGIRCSQEDIVRWDSIYGQIEQQANTFAATLLMPLDDFRRQIDPRVKPVLDDVGECAERYRVSLTAATLRWLGYTERRSVLVVSRDGFILWSRSSRPALRMGAMFRTANRPPVALPDGSLPMQPSYLTDGRGVVAHEAGVWFDEPCEESILRSDRYDFAMSLLHLDNVAARSDLDEETNEKDIYDGIINRTPSSRWLG